MLCKKTIHFHRVLVQRHHEIFLTAWFKAMMLIYIIRFDIEELVLRMIEAGYWQTCWSYRGFNHLVLHQHLANSMVAIMIWFANTTYHWVNAAWCVSYLLFGFSCHVEFDYGLFFVPEEYIGLTMGVTGRHGIYTSPTHEPGLKSGFRRF